MTTKNKLFRLSGKIQHYSWGGREFLPGLLGLPNKNDQPFAEYWLGAHHSAPSEIIMEDKKLLNEYIQQHPEVLGKQVHQTFGHLPYLLKVLDVRDMLSIQVHPSKAAAAIEFERENKSGIPLTAANRNYKDANHKPELMVALSDFWLLHGFKSPEKIIEGIESIPEFAFMLPLFKEDGYKKLYNTLMQMDQQEVNKTLQPLLERILAAYENDYLPKGNPHFWAARAAVTFNVQDKIDRGIFSIYLLNLVHLNKGEAIFQDAGILHAYLEGQNIEIMANSDNVLRGGLTVKHVDVDELMKHVRFEAVAPEVIYAGVDGAFASAAPDFQLNKWESAAAASNILQFSTTTEIFLVIEGIVMIKETSGNKLLLKKGEAAVAFAGAELVLEGVARAVLYRATVNLNE